jgi:heme exporter protein D
VNWKSAADFWAMGGYAFYVWGSYAAVAVVIGIELWLLRARRSRAVSELARAATRNTRIQ